MKLKRGIPVMLSLLILFAACRNHPGETGKTEAGAAALSNPGLVVADTITYQVLISNPNPDDTWTTKCLSQLHRNALIDSIFEMVYSGKVVAYNHQTNEKLTNRQIHDIENARGFSRNNIGMIQFTEAWYLNPANHAMTKKVLSMVLGTNVYTSEGELFGQTPVFRVEMK